jgi:hypothetical protein
LKAIFFGGALFSGIMAQRLLLYYRKLIVKEIFFYPNAKTSGLNIFVKILNGKILSDELKNIRIAYRDNEYKTPDYVFTSEDVKKISYFIEIKNEEFYIPRRLIKIKDAEAYKHIIEANINFENLEKI